jgi:8-oxo-dGTP diphosphatase
MIRCMVMMEQFDPLEARYQGAIMRGREVLLIQHREHASGRAYWLLPGGRREPGETEEACVEREMWEETGLVVAVERLLMDEPAPLDLVYQHKKTYLCTIRGGEAAPGYEPELAAQAKYAITDVRWLDLQNPAAWDATIVTDPETYPELLRLREVLGYSTGGHPIAPTPGVLEA